MNDDVKRWLSLPDEQQLLENSYYRREYEGAYAFFDKPVPTPWEVLAHEQRDKVRQQCIKHQQEMNAFGEKIRNGEI